jgi:hypothetical protein
MGVERQSRRWGGFFLWLGISAVLYAFMVGAPNDRNTLSALFFVTRPGWWWFTVAVYTGMILAIGLVMRIRPLVCVVCSVAIMLLIGALMPRRVRRYTNPSIEVRLLVMNVSSAVASYRFDCGTYPWGGDSEDPITIDPNQVARELLPTHPLVNPGQKRKPTYHYNRPCRDYLPELKGQWLKDYDGDGNVEIVDVWGYPIQFRVDPRTRNVVLWSLGNPNHDARASAKRPRGMTIAAWKVKLLELGDETADGKPPDDPQVPESERNTDYYFYGKGDTGNDITNL